MSKPHLTVHAFSISGHAHRVELFLSLLQLSYERVEVDLMHGAHKKPDFLAMNAFGQVPVLEDGDVVLADSNAILVYLAMKYDPANRWLPRDPLTAAKIQRWFSVAAGELQKGLGAARLKVLLNAKVDHDAARSAGNSLLGVMDAELAKQPFLAGKDPTLADVAMYTYTFVAPDGDVSLEPYGNVRAWHARIEALPGFLPMKRASAA